MSFLIFLCVSVFVFYRGRLFLAKFWLAFAEPLVQKMGRKAEAVVVSSKKDGESPLTEQQAEEIRK